MIWWTGWIWQTDKEIAVRNTRYQYEWNISVERPASKRNNGNHHQTKNLRFGQDANFEVRVNEVSHPQLS